MRRKGPTNRALDARHAPRGKSGETRKTAQKDAHPCQGPGTVSPAPLRAAQGADAADREIHWGGGGRLARTGGKAAVPQQYASESTAATVSKHEGGLRVVL